MNYYHGSPYEFEKFNLESISIVHLTPHIEYAMGFAFKDSDEGYLYEVEVKGHEHIEYTTAMSNICFASDDKLEIIKMTKVYK